MAGFCQGMSHWSPVGPVRMVKISIWEFVLLGRVVASRGSVRGVADQGQFELLNVGEGQILLVGVLSVINCAGMVHGLGDLLPHHL